jgi:hypothetical protein
VLPGGASSSAEYRTHEPNAVLERRRVAPDRHVVFGLDGVLAGEGHDDLEDVGGPAECFEVTGVVNRPAEERPRGAYRHGRRSQIETWLRCSCVADAEETVYVLRDWPDGRVGQLISALRAGRVPFVLEGNELAVPKTHESQVDSLVTQLDGAPPRPPGRPAPTAGGPHTYRTPQPTPWQPPPTGYVATARADWAARLRAPMREELRPWLIASGAAVVVGSLMPWISVATAFGSVSVSGTEGDGVITLGAGIVAAVLSALRRRLAALIVFALTALVAGYDVVTVSQQAEDVTTDYVRASVGWGLWLTLAGAVAGFILAWASAAGRPRLDDH